MVLILVLGDIDQGLTVLQSRVYRCALISPTDSVLTITGKLLLYMDGWILLDDVIPSSKHLGLPLPLLLTFGLVFE